MKQWAEVINLVPPDRKPLQGDKIVGKTIPTLDDAKDQATNKAHGLVGVAHAAAEAGEEAMRKTSASGARLAADYLPRVADLARRGGNTLARAVTTSSDLLAAKLDEAVPSKAAQAGTKRSSGSVVRRSLGFVKRRPIGTTVGIAVLGAAVAFLTRRRTTTTDQPKAMPDETFLDQAGLHKGGPKEAGQAAVVDHERTQSAGEA